MRGKAMLALAAIIGTPTSGATPAEADKFWTAVETGDNARARTLFDAAVTARLPADGKPRPDGELDFMLGALIFAEGNTSQGLGFLRAARTADIPSEDRAKLLVWLARAELAGGNLGKAIDAAEAVQAAGATDVIAASAARTRIEALIGLDPAKARAALADATTIRANDGAHAWDWSLYDAQLALLGGDLAAAKRAAGDALTRAVDAPLAAAGANARATALLAAVADRQGARGQAIALLAAAGHDMTGNGDMAKAVGETLPTCGTAVSPSDRVLLMVFRDEAAEITRVTPVWASRPGIAALFVDGVDPDGWLATRAISQGAALVDVACRTAPAQHTPGRHLPPDFWSSWSAAHGIYPRLDDRGDSAEMMDRASREVDAVTARFGGTSPLLIGPLLALREHTLQRILSDGDVPRTRLDEIDTHILDLVEKVGGTDSFMPVDLQPSRMADRLLAAKTKQDQEAIGVETLTKLIARTDFAVAYEVFLASSQFAEVPAADRAPLLDQLHARGLAAVGASDTRVAAVQLARAATARELGHADQLPKLARESALAGDLCAVRDVLPELKEQHIASEDYPPAGILGNLTGASVLDFSVDPHGELAQPRLIVATPPWLFDDSVARTENTIRFDPSRSATGPVACRGYTQTIRWNIPDADVLVSPGAMATPSEPST